jgi:Kef-type K+ transport system membrane component KefB
VTRAAPSRTLPAPARKPAIPPISLFLIQTLLVLVVPVVAWHATGLRRLAPLAVVQILTGIVLGPSPLGRLLPETWGPLIAPSALAPLSGVATLAVLLFAFVTGLHFETGQLRGRAFLVLGVGSTVLPALAGAVVGVALGALLQTKGLMEVVVLTILLDAGVIGPVAFSALVLMALVSTAATMPLTRLFLRWRQP